MMPGVIVGANTDDVSYFQLIQYSKGTRPLDDLHQVKYLREVGLIIQTFKFTYLFLT